MMTFEEARERLRKVRASKDLTYAQDAWYAIVHDWPIIDARISALEAEVSRLKALTPVQYIGSQLPDDSDSVEYLRATNARLVEALERIFQNPGSARYIANEALGGEVPDGC